MHRLLQPSQLSGHVLRVSKLPFGSFCFLLRPTLAPFQAARFLSTGPTLAPSQAFQPARFYYGLLASPSCRSCIYYGFRNCRSGVSSTLPISGQPLPDLLKLSKLLGSTSTSLPHLFQPCKVPVMHPCPTFSSLVLGPTLAPPSQAFQAARFY